MKTSMGKLLMAAALLAAVGAVVLTFVLQLRTRWPLGTLPGYCIVRQLDGTLCAINLLTGVKHTKRLSPDVTAYAFARDGSTAAFANGSTLVITGQRPRRIRFSGGIGRITVSPEGKWVVAEVIGGHRDSVVSSRLYLVGPAAQAATLQVAAVAAASSVQWIDERAYVYVGLDGRLRRVEASTGEATSLPFSAAEFAVSTDGSALVLDIWAQRMPVVTLLALDCIAEVPVQRPDGVSPCVLMRSEKTVLYTVLCVRFGSEVYDLMASDWASGSLYSVARGVGQRADWCARLPAWFR